jgi:hypothetical protein
MPEERVPRLAVRAGTAAEYIVRAIGILISVVGAVTSGTEKTTGPSAARAETKQRRESQGRKQ